MSALFTALLESESKESLAEMVCELRATNARLSEALGLLAEIADWYDDGDDDSHLIWVDAGAVTPITKLTLGVCRKARTALTTPSTGKG